ADEAALARRRRLDLAGDLVELAADRCGHAGADEARGLGRVADRVAGGREALGHVAGRLVAGEHDVAGAAIVDEHALVGAAALADGGTIAIAGRWLAIAVAIAGRWIPVTVAGRRLAGLGLFVASTIVAAAEHDRGEDHKGHDGSAAIKTSITK